MEDSTASELVFPTDFLVYTYFKDGCIKGY